MSPALYEKLCFIFSRNFICSRFSTGLQRRRKSGEVLKFTRDDQFGCPAISDFGKCFKTLERQYLFGRISRAQQFQRVGVCLLNFEDGCRLTFCFTDSAFLFRFRAEDRRFFLCFCFQDLRFLSPSATRIWLFLRPSA